MSHLFFGHFILQLIVFKCAVFCVVNRYEPLFLKKEEKKWYNSDVSLGTEP